MNRSDLSIIAEPSLEFRHGQRLTDPRNGLALFGPWDADSASRPGNVPYGVIGTSEGVDKFHAFARRMARPIVPNEERHHLRIWRPFPGFDAAFCADWPTEGAWVQEIDRTSLIRSSHLADEYRRAAATTCAYTDALDVAAKRDEGLRVIYCIVPDEVHQNCRPESRLRASDRIGRRPSNVERKKRAAGQLGLLSQYDPRDYGYSVDFRRQLKARAMAYGFPLQLLRESTLRLDSDDSPRNPRRGLTPLSDRAWNIATTTYYKAGGKPWRLSTAREGVCYVGLAFRRVDTRRSAKSACCAAQMFLDTGDGVVFKGEYGPWYSEKGREFHLSRSAAHDLLKGVLETYRELGGVALREVFIHSRSMIDANEFRGYREAVDGSVKVVGVRVRSERRDGARLFRAGKYPVQRGTLWRLNDRSALMWGSGFESELGTYRGAEVPLPIRVDIQHGEADIECVATDIMGLTKLNYNSCKSGDRLPVTIGFSDKVGEILIENGELKQAHPQFKFYI
ncbi:hypothetical protein [Candidatus Palauibacter sp.]|uniref:hypothetical protein n=1 Tax=Candidatus Palauibacter sp. TaxID=3101350 RepID=UPI003B027ABC